MMYLLFAFLISSFQLISAPPFEEIKDLATLPLLNPSLHNQKIEKIQLPNGLQAVLVSDPQVKQSAVALTVMAGSWLEPDEFHGLAHFLEHMLFLGTSEYPEESSFTRFLTEHGGQTNAFTHGDYTSYMFALNSDGLSEGLKRFSSFFKTPLFNPSGVLRELNAIDQEFDQGFNNEDSRTFHVLKQAASPLHPFSRFQTGNSKTLANATTDDLRKWFEGHYSANLMKLYVLSSEPIEELRNQVIEDFSGIPNRNLKPYDNKSRLFSKDTLGSLIRIAPKNANQKLMLLWEIPAKYPLMLESRPADLICTALGYEGKNSLLALLKKEGLADLVSCGSVDLASQTYLLAIEIKLTSKGLIELDTVIERVFQTINMLGKTPFPEYIFDNYSQMLRQKYQFQQRDEPFEWAMAQAPQLALEPIATYPELTKTLRVFDKTAVNSLIHYLTPQNALFVLSSPAQKLKKVEPWMQIAYDIEPIPNAKLKKWSEALPNPEIKYPPKNPFLAHSPKATKTQIDKDTYPAFAPPEVILDSPGGKVYYAPDPFYQVPRTSVLLQIQSPEIKDGKPFSVVMADLYVKALKDNLQDLLDEALMADMEVGIERGFGSVQMAIEGFTESVEAFFPYVIPRLINIEITPEKFDALKSDLLRDYENNLVASPVKQAFDRFKASIFERYTNLNQKRSAINKITFPLFQNYVQELFKINFIKGAVTGSITAAEAKKMIGSLDQALHPTQASDALSYYPKIKAIDGPVIHDLTTKADGNIVFIGIELNGYTPQLQNIQEMLSQTMSEAFFAELRTKQQTGYIVFSDALEAQKHLFNFFLVQSTTYTTEELLWRIELFISTYASDLKNIITKERFEGLKNSLDKVLRTPPATLKIFGEKMFKLGFEIEDFGWNVKRVDDLSRLTYEDFISSSEGLLARSNKKRLAIALKGQIRGQPPFEYSLYKKPKPNGK